jgi:hypothetical protein
MYNLEELNRKDKNELLDIAREMSISNAEKMDETELRLTIIDEQASNFASNATTTEKTPRKRSRVSVKNVDRVYTANQDKAKKVDKNMKITKDESLFADLSEEEKHKRKIRMVEIAKILLTDHYKYLPRNKNK